MFHVLIHDIDDIWDWILECNIFQIIDRISTFFGLFSTIGQASSYLPSEFPCLRVMTPEPTGTDVFHDYSTLGHNFGWKIVPSIWPWTRDSLCIHCLSCSGSRRIPAQGLVSHLQSSTPARAAYSCAHVGSGPHLETGCSPDASLSIHGA